MAECVRLESVCSSNVTGGSNPPLSAQVAIGREYTTSYELILSRIPEQNNRRFLIYNCTLRYQFCDMTSFKYGTLRTVGALTIRADH